MNKNQGINSQEYDEERGTHTTRNNQYALLKASQE